MFQVIVLGLHSAAKALSRSWGVAGTSLGGSDTLSLEVAFVIVRPMICEGRSIVKAVPVPTVPYSSDCHPAPMTPPCTTVSQALGSLVAVATRLSDVANTVTPVGVGAGVGAWDGDGDGEAGGDEDVDEPPPPHATPAKATACATTKSARRLPVMVHLGSSASHNACVAYSRPTSWLA